MFADTLFYCLEIKPKKMHTDFEFFANVSILCTQRLKFKRYGNKNFKK